MRAEADNQKARLALMGVEARIQQVMLQDKVWYRVRLGPYPRMDEVNILRGELARQGIDARRQEGLSQERLERTHSETLTRRSRQCKDASVDGWLAIALARDWPWFCRHAPNWWPIAITWPSSRRRSPTIRPRLEVIEFFSYGCPHCSDFHPLVSKWATALPSDVVFKRVPISFGRPQWASLARLYYALRPPANWPSSMPRSSAPCIRRTSALRRQEHHRLGERAGRR
jgi:thiol-disulfide isomerase/thioredoxin